MLGGVLLPGARLREEGLCERFGTGRHTVRAALSLLANSGLVTHERNRGAFVREVTRERVDHIFEFRKVLELGSLRIALDTGADLSGIEAAVAALERLSPNTPWQRTIEVHADVHREIVRAAGNPQLLDSYHACENELQVLLTYGEPAFSTIEIAAQHRQMFSLLELGGETAIEALARDIEVNGRQSLLVSLAGPTEMGPTA